MVRLSPKALRFAAEATHSYFADGSGTRQEVARWQAWHAAVSDTASGPPAAGSEGYVDVPEDVAEVFLAAIEDFMAAMRRRSELEGDEDGDLGNDLALLGVIENKLAAELRPSPGVRP